MNNKRKAEFNKLAAFIRIPKTASTSVVRMLDRDYRIVTEHRPTQQKNKLLILNSDNKKILPRHPLFKNYFVFSLIRNPFDRFISGWKFAIENKWLDSKYSPLDFIHMIRNEEKMNQLAYLHVVPTQASYLWFKGQLLADVVCRQEDFETEIPPLMESLGIRDFPIVRANATKNDLKTSAYYMMKYRRLSRLHYHTFKQDWDLLPYNPII